MRTYKTDHCPMCGESILKEQLPLWPMGNPDPRLFSRGMRQCVNPLCGGATEEVRIKELVEKSEV